MSRERWIIAIVLLVSLAGLLAWQLHRERLMAQCLDKGGYWHGPRSVCHPTPVGPILKRALERS